MAGQLAYSLGIDGIDTTLVRVSGQVICDLLETAERSTDRAEVFKLMQNVNKWENLVRSYISNAQEKLGVDGLEDYD